MTDTDLTPTAVHPLNDRIVFGLRQAAFIGIALLVAGLVTDRLLPEEALERSIVATPFLWAIVLWLIVFMFNAIAFERSQMGSLEAAPLYSALVVGAFLFVSGLVGFEAGAFSRRVTYLFATSLGGVMFWWAVFSLGYLIAQRLRD